MAKTLWPENEEEQAEGGNLPRGAHTRGVSNNFMPDERLSDRDRGLNPRGPLPRSEKGPASHAHRRPDSRHSKKINKYSKYSNTK